MKQRLEAHMIGPIRDLMIYDLGLSVIAEEFSAGYGTADLVGAIISEEHWRNREKLGLSTPLDHQHLIEVLIELKPRIRTSIEDLLPRISFSEGTLRSKVLPNMVSRGLIERDSSGYVRLLVKLPHPTEKIVAIEAKQTRWRDAVLQARRYTFFADQTYVAVWNETVDLVDKSLLKQHHIGLIGVETNTARVLIEAPKRKPREPKMNRYCAEFLYRQALTI